MGMWDWYNRPGGITTVATWKVALFLIVAGVLSSIVLWVLFSVLASVVFVRAPAP
ncbi:MAG: hypothetical protein AVDCRST_MAG77-4856 [uncultured Chloroflexi bacterium]|uniref:Uncharacterized protein n=1 Tax=uncultured Chloroflexota bacterium TaxID=166587 RepID=A0A6J4K174_9CHLR|nr:MAG: hypothetical protein AVDCRST_MAG77-4856 [uncultured Chloroflexota bacterium]